MGRILLTWELGGGLGHLMNLRPLAAGLLRGHQLFLAAKDLSQVRRVINDERIVLLAAPWNVRRKRASQTIVNFADLLLTIGFDDETSLASHVDAWRSLFKFVAPDLMICDHSPTALLAARGTHFAVATVGTGFFCPVDESPLRILRRIKLEDREAAHSRERQLLATMNAVLAARQLPTLQSVSGLYHDGTTRHFLLTFRELDHFEGRSETQYWGAWPYGLPGEPFVRPGAEPCLFAYLKPFPALLQLLANLAESRINAVVYVDGLDSSDKAKYESSRLRFANGPIDIREAARNCDLALTNANHGTCVAMLLAGKPLVHVPPYLEQSLLAAAIDRFGASISARTTDAVGICLAIDRVLTNSSYAQAATDFAERYRDHPFDRLAQQMLDQMERLIQSLPAS